MEAMERNTTRRTNAKALVKCVVEAECWLNATQRARILASLITTASDFGTEKRKPWKEIFAVVSNGSLHHLMKEGMMSDSAA
jgi:hypothetical protein